ncbi:hypothetical protein [Flavobacterium sp. J27]|uniref:hypothetical protein n=1 Tax=Flavobacterium sp. J27 TaxID=2060419 RepID=UPI0010306786|nr:hypothetical protein [Flavobacterium sp. J27]
MKTLFFFLTCFSCFIFSQENDSYLNQVDALLTTENLPFNYGKAHLVYFRPVISETNQFFTTELNNGSLKFDNQTYHNVNIKYDVLNDELVSYNSKGGLVVDKTKVNYFQIKKNTFVNIPSLGFTEIIHTTETDSLLIKHKKTSKETITSDKTTGYVFSNKKEFYLKKDGVLYKIKSKKSFSQIFPKQKIKISNFYKAYQEKYSESMEQFYSNLLNVLHEK